MKSNIRYFVLWATVFILLAEIFSFTSIVVAQKYNREEINKLENSDEIIIYRFGPDRTIEKVITIEESEDTTDVTKVAADECEKLCSNDPEIQQFIDSDEMLYFKVESKGKGIHFALFRPMMRIKPVLRAGIFFRYFNEDCYTKVNNQTLAEGPHKGSILGFVGYAGFSTRIIGKTVIYGYSLFRVNVK